MCALCSVLKQAQRLQPGPGLPDENFNKKPNNAKKRTKRPNRLFKGQKKSQTVFAVLPLLCHKKHLNYKNIKIVSSKLRLNLAWHCTAALILPYFSCFVKLHTLCKMVPQFAYLSTGSFLYESLSYSLEYLRSES